MCLTSAKLENKNQRYARILPLYKTFVNTGWLKKQNEHNFQQVCHSTERPRNQTNLWPCLLRWSRNLLVRKMVPATLQTIVATMKTTKSPTWYVTNDWWTFVLLVVPPLSVPLTIIFFVAQSCLPEKERETREKDSLSSFSARNKTVNGY